MDLIELHGGAILRGGSVELNQDVIDDTREAFALHAERGHGNDAGGLGGLSRDRTGQQEAQAEPGCKKASG